MKHSCRELHVLGLAPVRCARECELLAPPPARVEAARLEERKELERLGAGAPDGEKRRIAGAAQQLTIGTADCCMHAMTRLDRVSARCDDVEIKVGR